VEERRAGREGPGYDLRPIAERARIPVEQALEAARRSAAALAQDPRVQLVYVYGSTAAGHATVRDVDLAVLSDRPLSLDDLVRLRADLVAAAAADIDLVSLNDASIALAHEVVESGRCLYARSPDVETDFVTRTRARYWDFEPFRAEQWRLLGERLEERRRER
jgi:predicted nucleotidyltransferase